MTKFQRDTLELGHMTDIGWQIRMTDSQNERQGLYDLEEQDFIRIKSIAFSKGQPVAFLYRLTEQGASHVPA